MAKARSRARVDYTELLSPAARGGEPEEHEVVARRAGGKKAGKRRGDDEKERERDRERDESPPRKKKKKEKEVAAAVRNDEEVAARDGEGGASEMAALRAKFDALREFREQETARLLKEARDLAKQEKRTYEQLVAKLKDEVGALLSRAQRVDADHKKQHEEIQAEHKLRVETLKRERDETLESNERLRRRVKELETELAASSRSTRSAGSRQSISAADAAATAQAGDASVELTQAKKLLELYRLVTSTELRLIETMDDADDADQDNYTDVACAVVDSVSGKRFVFDLAVPHDANEEVEYVPSDKPSQDFKTPSYLQDELSFKRSELTKFMRTLLDVVIRKKKQSAETTKR